MASKNERKCPHCNGSLEQYEDPKAVEIITTLEAKVEALEPRLEQALLAVGLASTLGVGEIDANNPVGMMQDVVAHVTARLEQVERENVTLKAEVERLKVLCTPNYRVSRTNDGVEIYHVDGHGGEFGVHGFERAIEHFVEDEM